LKHADNCTHPIGGAKVEIYDVDYCWFWYNQELVKTGVTDANGFFDITFTWCVPLWCILEVLVQQPVLVDPHLRDRVREILDERVFLKFPPPPPPPDPWTFERQLTEAGVALPAVRRIARAHQGDATIANQSGGGGAIARLSLPLAAESRVPGEPGLTG
jgi:hypothetical protein